MSPTTEVHDHALPHPPVGEATPSLRRVGRKIKLIVIRSIFWAYERGSWHYDVIVAAILAFIFLSPRAWFNDRPTLQMTDLRHQQGIVEMGRSNKEVRYLLDARLVDSRSQKPEIAVPLILKEHLQKSFTVRSIDAVRDRHQVILGYTVVVEQ
jgi:hypothetical protein